MRLIGSFHTMVIHGRSASPTGSVTACSLSCRCGARVPAMAPMVARTAATPRLHYGAAVADDQRSLGGPGIALVVAGAALVVLAVASLQWYRATGTADVPGSGFTFRDLQQNADQLGTPVASAYF